MNMKKVSKKRRPGFTLVEMVIVITILGILSGLAFMKFGDVQTKAKQNADYVAASNLSTATSLYMDEYPNEVSEFGKDEAENSEKLIDVEILKTKGYITSVPKSQSHGQPFVIKRIKKGDGEELEVRVEYKKVDNTIDEEKTQVFYPKPEKK